MIVRCVSRKESEKMSCTMSDNKCILSNLRAHLVDIYFESTVSHGCVKDFQATWQPPGSWTETCVGKVQINVYVLNTVFVRLQFCKSVCLFVFFLYFCLVGLGFAWGG